MYKYERDQKTTYHEKGLQKEKNNFLDSKTKLIIFSTIKYRFNKETATEIRFQEKVIVGVLLLLRM